MSKYDLIWTHGLFVRHIIIKSYLSDKTPPDYPGGFFKSTSSPRWYSYPPGRSTTRGMWDS